MSQIETKPFSGGVTIGVTGGAGSGKSLLCRLLGERGAALLDADGIAREVVMPGTKGLDRVAARFGPSVLAGDGTLDRAALRRRILADDEARKALEGILHPEIIALMRERMAAAGAAGNRVVVAEVPLLFELGMAAHFDKTVLVKVPREVKIRRLVERDRVSMADARRLLDLQMSDAEKEECADIVVDNNGTVADLRKNVDRLYEMFYL